MVLVHGAWQAGWCWDEVAARLRARGHLVVTPDLPAHGGAPTPLDALTLQHYVDALIFTIRAQDDPVILAGHSMGGLVMRVAESVPERVQAVVYVAAILPPAGGTMLDIVGGFDAEYLAQLAWSPDGAFATIRPEGARTFLYPLAPAALADNAISRLTPEPAAPFRDPVHTTSERLGRVPAFYVECLRDRVVPLALQRQMQSHVRIDRVLSLEADHSPFLSTPEELSRCLEAISLPRVWQ